MFVNLIEIAKRVVKWDQKLEIYQNGVDNAYPERMDRYKNNSITARMASIMMKQYVVGQGIDNQNDNKLGDSTYIETLKDISSDVVDNRGVFIHLKYNAALEVVSHKIIPFSKCRLGKKDSNEYNGKILVCDDWSAKKINKEDVSVIDVFNKDKNVLDAQIKAAGGIEDYKGQILYVNMDKEFYYPLSRIHPVYNDCDSEAQSSIFKNTSLRRGFFGKTLIVTRPLGGDGYIETDSDDPRVQRQQRELESEREEFKNTIQDFIGAENNGNALHLEMDFAGEKLDDAILFKNIDANIDDKLFEYTENSASKNILMAYNNIPIALVKSPDSALFSNSGASLTVAKETYQENTTLERKLVETLFNKITTLYGDSTQYTITPLITAQTESRDLEAEAEEENRKAQANLRGSVAGVTSLLAIQQSVSEGTTTRDSAVSMIVNIFGYTEQQARDMLGTPKPAEDVTE